MDFVYDETDLPFPKIDGASPPPGYAPDEWILSDDWNPLCQAVVDLRTAITGGQYHGLTPVVSDTAFYDAAKPYLYYKSDNTLWLHKGNDTYYELTGRAAASDLANYVPKTTTLTAGTGLSGGGDLSVNRSVSLANTAVTPGSYSVSAITVDAQGRITAAANDPVITIDGTNLRAGINATSPSHALDVRKSITADYVVRVENDSASGFSAVAFYTSGSALAGSMGWSNASAFLTGSYGASSLYFSAVANVTFAMLNNYTNQNTLYVTNISTSGSSSIVVTDNAGTTKGAFGWSNASFSTATRTSRVWIWLAGNLTVTDDTTHFLFVDKTNTYIGINSATPSATLDVYQKVVATGTPTAFRVTGAAHTTLTHADANDVYINLARTVQFGQTTTLADQRAINITAPTYSSSVATKTLTRAHTVYISGAPVAGTNLGITNSYALYVASGSALFGGAVTFGSNLYHTGNFVFSAVGGTTSFTIKTISGGTQVAVAQLTSGSLTSPMAFSVTGGAHTALTNAETTDILFDFARTVSWGQTTTLAQNRAFVITSPTYDNGGASKQITDVATMNIVGVPVQGTNAFFVRTMGLWMNGTWAPTVSGTKLIVLALEPTINQTGSANGDYTALHINVTETAATGTNKRLIDFQTGGTSRLQLTSAGLLTLRGNAANSPLNVYNDDATSDGGARFYDDTGTLRLLVGGAGSSNAQTTLRNKGFLYHPTDFYFYRGSGNFDGNIDTAGTLTWGTTNVFKVMSDGKLGFNGTTPVAKGTVTGNRGDGSALASLLTYLASRGDITDSSSP